MSEQEFATILGIAREELARLRSRYLANGRHWKKNGRGVVYLEAGVEELRGILGLQGAQDGPDGVREARLRVVKVNLPSGRHVRCSDGVRDDLICDVRVAKNFRVGMELEAVAKPGADRCFVFHGRLPRQPGRW